MNKEEIEKDDNYWKGYIEKQKEAEEICKMCKYRKRYRELIEKEALYNELKRILTENKTKWILAQEILDIIEGEKK